MSERVQRDSLAFILSLVLTKVQDDDDDDCAIMTTMIMRVTEFVCVSLCVCNQACFTQKTLMIQRLCVCVIVAKLTEKEG